MEASGELYPLVLFLLLGVRMVEVVTRVMRHPEVDLEIGVDLVIPQEEVGSEDTNEVETMQIPGDRQIVGGLGDLDRMREQSLEMN